MRVTKLDELHSGTFYETVRAEQWSMLHNDMSTKRYRLLDGDGMCYTTVHVTKWYVLHNSTCHKMVRVTKWYSTKRLIKKLSRKWSIKYNKLHRPIRD